MSTLEGFHCVNVYFFQDVSLSKYLTSWTVDVSWNTEMHSVSQHPLYCSNLDTPRLSLDVHSVHEWQVGHPGIHVVGECPSNYRIFRIFRHKSVGGSRTDTQVTMVHTVYSDSPSLSFSPSLPISLPPSPLSAVPRERSLPLLSCPSTSRPVLGGWGHATNGQTAFSCLPQNVSPNTPTPCWADTHTGTGMCIHTYMYVYICVQTEFLHPC